METGRIEGVGFCVNVGKETDPFFDDSSLAFDGKPRIVILVGPPAVGKTTIRKQNYSTGYVLVDAVPIFLNLCQGEYLPFPDVLEEPMKLIGMLVANQAVKERRNIVTELIGDSSEQLNELIDAMLAVGYKADIVYVDCPFEEAVRRNLNRDDDCISAFYAGKYQWEWLLEAAKEFKQAQDPGDLNHGTPYKDPTQG